MTTAFLAYNQGWLRLGLVDRLELIAYDARLGLTALEKHVDPRIVIIDIDEHSLVEEGHWPWNRIKLAQLVKILFDVYHLEILGFDSVFAERDSSEELEMLETLAYQRNDLTFLNNFQHYKPLLNPDFIFADELKKHPVILGYYFDKSNRRSTYTGEIGKPLFAKGSKYYDMLILKKIGDSKSEAGTLDEAIVSSFTGNIPELQRAALANGFYSIPSQDKDGILRRIQLLEKYDGALYESLSLSLARHYLSSDVTFKTLTNENGAQIIDGVEIGTGLVPIDDEGTSYIPYRGKAYSFRYISATDVLNQTVENPKDLEYAIGIVGTTAAGLVDLRNTPLQQNNYPGVEVHATTVAGLLDADFRSRPYYSTAAEFIILLFVGLLLSCLLPSLKATGQTTAWLVLSGLLIACNLYVWDAHNIILSITPVLLLTLSLYMLNIVYGYFFESKIKTKLSALFGQYIPPELVDEMAKDPENYSLEAKKEELTVLFSDVRGFTQISEGLDPKTLSNLMNELLSPMTKVVHNNQGTIDKYMGDAMMAFWGAPIHDPKHASKAVHSGLEILKELKTVNAAFAKKNWPEIKIGVGLNTGLMNVGNMGSEFRMAYTILGDAVNLGSRVEGLTKAYGVDFIVTEYTASAAPEYEYRKLDIVKVKGKDKPVTILEPMDLTKNVSIEALHERDQFHHAIELYMERNFADAFKELSQLNQQYGERFVHNLYIERCQHFMLEPPTTDWDGVFTFTTK